MKLTINEKLFSPGMSGSVDILDSNGFLESFSMIGEEQFYIEFNGVNGYTYERYFNVYNISNINVTKGDKVSKTYTIYFMSNVLEKNIGNKYSMSSLSFSTETIVKDIFNSKLNSHIECEESNISVSIATPYWKPFKIINYLSSLSHNADGYGDYILFENRNGWYWKTIRSLISSDILHNLIQETMVSQKDSIDGSLTIRNISCSQLFDTVDGATEGVYAASATIYSIINKNVEHLAIVKDTESNDNAPRLNEFQPNYSRGKKYDHPGLDDVTAGSKMPGENDYYKNLNAPLGSHVIKSNEPNTPKYTHEHDITLLARQLDATINQMAVSAEVDGNSNLTVGECAYIVVPSVSKSENGLDNTFTGKYLITQVNHVLTPDIYKTMLTLIKDSYVEEFVERDNKQSKPKIRRSSSSAVSSSSRG